MKKTVEYPTWHEIHRKEKREMHHIAAATLLMLAAAALLRSLLTDCFLPDGQVLEGLADVVQNGEVPLGEAVVTFCREMIENGVA